MRPVRRTARGSLPRRLGRRPIPDEVIGREDRPSELTKASSAQDTYGWPQAPRGGKEDHRRPIRKPAALGPGPLAEAPARSPAPLSPQSSDPTRLRRRLRSARMPARRRSGGRPRLTATLDYSHAGGGTSVRCRAGLRDPSLSLKAVLQTPGASGRGRRLRRPPGARRGPWPGRPFLAPSIAAPRTGHQPRRRPGPCAGNARGRRAGRGHRREEPVEDGAVRKTDRVPCNDLRYLHQIIQAAMPQEA
jgi:hypothetical protein